ncbi:MAG: hypothetical protein L6408_08540 [Nanoarchaeota archaeon]|nr:hypothetical protein [Nanoarchaeota archaeon]
MGKSKANAIWTLFVLAVISIALWGSIALEFLKGLLYIIIAVIFLVVIIFLVVKYYEQGDIGWGA